MKALLFGIQGSGKSTIGEYLAQKFNVPFVSIGEILRKKREEDTETGRLIKSIIDHGDFIPDRLAMEIINKRLDEKDAEKGFILDGAPRNLAQEKLFTHKLDLVIIVNLDEELAIERLLSRNRHDDSEAAIRKRIAWHKENTEPLMDFFKKKGTRIVEIDNSFSEDEVRENIDELFKN
jgi:adenylate kinase